MTINLDFRTIGQILQTERVRLTQYTLEEEAALHQSLDASPDMVDLAQTFTARERRRALLAQAQHHLRQVEAALERLAEGTYGICTGCRQNIEAERLRILPHVDTCIRCQREQENLVRPNA